MAKKNNLVRLITISPMFAGNSRQKVTCKLERTVTKFTKLVFLACIRKILAFFSYESYGFLGLA